MPLSHFPSEPKNQTALSHGLDIDTNEHIDVQILRICMKIGDEPLNHQEVLDSLSKIFTNRNENSIGRRFHGVFNTKIKNENRAITYARNLYLGIHDVLKDDSPLTGNLLGAYIWEYFAISVWKPYTVPKYIPEDILNQFGHDCEKENPQNYEQALKTAYIQVTDIMNPKREF